MKDFRPGKKQELALRHLQNAFAQQCLVVEWHEADYSSVHPGDILATVETSKVTAVIKAETNGLLRQKHKQGTYVDLADIIGWIE